MPATPHLDQRLRAAPQAVLERDDVRLAWPHGGLPVALDRAGATILDCFAEPLTPRELAADLAAALDLTPEEARRSAASTTMALLNTGHLIPDGMRPMPASRLAYPPSASP